MTPRQRDALAFIIDYQQRNGGASPSYAEIMRHMGYRSKSRVWELVRALAAAGHIRFLPARARSIEVLALRQTEREFLAAADAYAEESRRKGTVSLATAARFFETHRAWRDGAETAEGAARQTDIEDRMGRKVA